MSKEQTPWSKWEFKEWGGIANTARVFQRRRVSESWFGLLRTEVQTRLVPQEIVLTHALASLNGEPIITGETVTELRKIQMASEKQSEQLATAVELAEGAAAAITTLRQANAALAGHNRNLMKALVEEKDAYNDLLAAVNATKPLKAKRRVRRAR